ncbi:hypothetical protein NH26_13860 [Flammeovirga pacifica]|uniref:Uncharacterized protein n=2 Tax=Flammeovirga pacifica TaxID=915059 RepID=A0A1S1Z254_FLAPC|nr:hypothetical protein NH26_13860 [Flammeovirga pacifica]
MHPIYGQDAKDTSKPTNIYSQIDHFLEYNHSPRGEMFSYNPRISYTLDDAYLLVMDLPYRFHSSKNVAGLGDPKIRYFYVPYKDDSKIISSMGLSLNITLPLGNTKFGLGDGSLKIATGIMLGYIANRSKSISFFPTISYQYISKKHPENSIEEVFHGINIELLSSIVINDDIFIQIKPIIDIEDINNFSHQEFSLEIEPVINICNGKFQVGTYYKGVFQKQSIQ